MKIFIFEYVSDLTENYHSGGGLVVIANDEAQVDALLAAEAPSAKLTDEERKAVKVFDVAGTPEPEVFVFANAGCC